MYDFQAPYDSTLTFAENDLFVVLKRNNKDHEWVHVIKLNGENGYVSISIESSFLKQFLNVDLYRFFPGTCQLPHGSRLYQDRRNQTH
jgi:hypothetical protein